jgi:hypothetical protein
MRTRNNKNGDKIIKVVYESEPNGIGFRQLSRKTGLYQKSLSLWLKYLTVDLNFTTKDSIGHIHLTEDAIKKYNTDDLIIPPDTRTKNVKKNLRKRSVTKVLGKNYAEIIILILCLAVFGERKLRAYKKPQLGLLSIPNPFNMEQTHMYGNTKKPIPGVGLSDLINKVYKEPNYSPNKTAYLPKYHINVNNNELFGYLRISQKNIQKYFNLLSKNNILIPIDNRNYKDSRYKISDKLLSEFVKKSIIAFNNDVDTRLEYAYIYGYLRKKENSEYIALLKKWYGRNRKFSNISEYINKSKNIEVSNNLKEHYRKYIDRCDNDIFEYGLFEKTIMKEKNEYKLIIGEKYKTLQEKYPLIINTFFDMLFPQLLREIWYKRKVTKK